MADMTAAELGETMNFLGVNPTEAAQLLGVAPRTMRRWLLEGEEIPGPAIVALRAWRTLHARNLNWKPDTKALFEDDQDQIARHRRHVIDLAAAVARVERRGGPQSPWIVDLAKNSATCGPYEVHFYRLKSEGGFSLASYRRRDGITADLAKDTPFLEDAVYCIGRAIARAQTTVPALEEIAPYTRDHSSVFVTDGPKLLTPTQKAKRKEEIEALADKIDELAIEAATGKAGYTQFEALLAKLHAAGFFPTMSLVSAVAKAMA